jgi:hypothetical protein
MDKSEAWQKWWSVVRGAAPVGSYNPQEDNMHKAWMAAWDAAQAHADKEITHLKEQLMRANTNDGAYKAAFLAGQMSRDKK